MLKKSEELLEVIREEFPEFIFSNKIKSIETETILKNDAGLEYINYDRLFTTELIIKDKNSVNVFDTAVARGDREFDIEVILKDIRDYLSVYNNKVELPECNKIPVISSFYGFGSKIIDASKWKIIVREHQYLKIKWERKYFRRTLLYM